MIGLRITQPATLHSQQTGAKDAAGDRTTTFVDHDVLVEIQQRDGSEFRDGQYVSVTRWYAFIRPDTTLPAFKPSDELTVDGRRYTFDGEPWQVRHPRTGQVSHWYARLRRTS